MHSWWERKIVQSLWKTISKSLKKLHAVFPCDSAISILGVYPREVQTYVQAKTCTRTFITALFIIAARWKPPRCLSPDDWINKTEHIHTLDYYSAVKEIKY